MSNSSTAKKSPKKNKKNVLYNDKCSKLEVTLTLNGKTEVIFVDNKKNISTIRDMVYNIFYPIQGKFQLIYKLKDISPFEDIPLYKYFKNLMKISITVNPINPQNLLSRNDSSPFNKSLQDVTEIDKNEASFGAGNQSQINNTQNPLLEKDRLLCNECHTEIITNFCRHCNLFLCKYCSEKYSSPHHDHFIANINVAEIEKSAKTYKDMVNKDCFLTGKKFEEYKEIFKDIINKNNQNAENKLENIQTIKENKEENVNDDYINNDINRNLENINNMINQDNEDNNNKEENKIELEGENNNPENKNLNEKEKENEALENTNENNTNQNENINALNNNETEENKKRDIRDVDKWLSDMEASIEKLTDSLSKNNGANSSESNISLRDVENNYEYTFKKLQKINAEKNKKDLDTIFNEMHELDLNIRNMDSNLNQCLNNSDVNKINAKILKDLNQELDNTIKKLMKNSNIKEKLLDNGIKNNL